MKNAKRISYYGTKMVISHKTTVRHELGAYIYDVCYFAILCKFFSEKKPAEVLDCKFLPAFLLETCLYIDNF